MVQYRGNFQVLNFPYFEGIKLVPYLNRWYYVWGDSSSKTHTVSLKRTMAKQ